MLKILQARLHQYVNQELSDVQAGFRKGRGSRFKLPTSTRSKKKQENLRKTSTSASLTMLKPLTVWITTNCGKFLKEIGILDHLTCPLEAYMQNKKQQLVLDIQVQNWERSMSRLYIVTLLI